MSDVGTLAWARRTGGRLSRRDTAALALEGVRSQAAMLPARVAAAAGLHRDRLLRADVRDVPIPDSPLARSAEEAAQVMSAPLVAHSHRTYLWGMVLARHDGLAPDPEEAYVASLLHDAGLPEAVERHDDRCFTVVSADMAQRLGATAAVREAITLHLNPEVAVERGGVARVVNQGAALDVLGMRRWEIHPDTVAAVHALHPGAGFADAIDGLFRAHKRAAPRSRVAFLYRYGAFAPLLRLAWRR